MSGQSVAILGVLVGVASGVGCKSSNLARSSQADGFSGMNSVTTVDSTTIVEALDEESFILASGMAPMTLDQASTILCLSSLPAPTLQRAAATQRQGAYRLAGLGAGDALGVQLRHRSSAIVLLERFNQHRGAEMATVPVQE